MNNYQYRRIFGLSKLKTPQTWCLNQVNLVLEKCQEVLVNLVFDRNLFV